MSIQSLMIHSINVYKPVHTYEGATKKPLQTFVLNQSGVPARIEALSSKDIDSVLGKFPQAKWRAMLPADLEINDGYQVEYESVIYVVRQIIRDNNRERNNYITCFLEERK